MPVLSALAAFLSDFSHEMCTVALPLPVLTTLVLIGGVVGLRQFFEARSLPSTSSE